MSYTKSNFMHSLKQSMNKKYSLDWQHSNETLKEGKLVTYLFLKNNFRLEKYLILLKPEYRKPLCRLRVSKETNKLSITSFPKFKPKT